MTHYLTDEDTAWLQTTKLSRKTPFAIYHVSTSPFSVARFYGACTFNGDTYLYKPDGDELIREDVIAAIEKRRKPKRAAPKRRTKHARDGVNNDG